MNESITYNIMFEPSIKKRSIKAIACSELRYRAVIREAKEKCSNNEIKEYKKQYVQYQNKRNSNLFYKTTSKFKNKIAIRVIINSLDGVLEQKHNPEDITEILNLAKRIQKELSNMDNAVSAKFKPLFTEKEMVDLNSAQKYQESGTHKRRILYSPV